jgi:hypothetical protein
VSPRTRGFVAPHAGHQGQVPDQGHDGLPGGLRRSMSSTSRQAATVRMVDADHLSLAQADSAATAEIIAKDRG